MRVVVFDLETRLNAEDLSKDKEIGWARLRDGDGGISALAIYDLADEWLYLYDEKSIKEAAAHLENASVVVGYRTEGFDVPCVEGILGRRLRLREHLDLYALIARTNASHGLVGTRGDFTLDALCRRTIGRGKEGSGAHAPALYADKRFGELFNYCGGDVRLTRDLLIHITERGYIVNPSGSLLYLELPSQVRQGMNIVRH